MAYTTLLSGYAALASAVSSNGVVTELSGNGYARQAMTLSYDAVTGTIAYTGVDFTFTGVDSAAVDLVVYDASSGGNVALYWPISSWTSGSGTSLSIPGGTIVLARAAATPAPTVPLAASTPGGTVLGVLFGTTTAVTTGPATFNLSSAGAWAAQAPVVPVTYAAAQTVNAALVGNSGGAFSITLTGNVTSFTVQNAVIGATYYFYLIQDGTGSRTWASQTGFKFVGGSKTLTTTAGAQDIVIAYYDGTTFWATLNKAYA